MTVRISIRRSIAAFYVMLALAVVGVSTSAWAADSSAGARAARLTWLQGAVTVDRIDDTDSQAARLNLPLLAGVRLATGDDGQAEIEFEDGSLVRLTPNSLLSLDTLTVEPADASAPGVFTTRLTLLHGLAYVELRATQQYRYTLDAGGDVLSPVENTTVRINFDQPPAIFAVLDGAARVDRQTGQNGVGYQREVRAGESLHGDPAIPAGYSLTQEIADNSWDTWNEDRDQAASAEAANRTAARDNYAGAQGYGWSDLDAHGTWYDVPGQGPVWQPTVAVVDAGFDPYGNGAWVWYPGTGYLWASGYAWGWTPYRCGSWSYFNGFGWGWAPVTACGRFGWEHWGGGRPVNIAFAPNGYRVPHVPVRPPGPVHPFLPTRVTGNPAIPADPSGLAGGAIRRGPQRIGGVTATPLQPVGTVVAPRAGEPIRSSLRRDFPVDSETHAAITGHQGTPPTIVHSAAGWHPADRHAAAVPSYSRQGVAPAYRSPAGPAPRVRSDAPAGQAQRPAFTPAPAQQPTFTPAPAQRPTFTPAPVQRPTFTPAPVQQSSPPPAPAPHSAPAAAPASVPARPSPK